MEGGERGAEEEGRPGGVEETHSFVKREKGEITRRRCVGDEGVVMRGLL